MPGSRLIDFLEGTLPPADREAIEAHVSGCPRCVAFVESYLQTPRIMRGHGRRLSEDLSLSLRRFLALRR